MDSASTETEFNSVTCAFCGLACDDLRVHVQGRRVRSIEGGAAECRRWFEQASLDEDDKIIGYRSGGRPIDQDEAIARAARILDEAKLPVIAGLATDVNGMRAALRLAARCGAVIDHMNGAGVMRNMRVVQEAGWMTATLTEVRNRADLLVVVGNRVFEMFPRLLERVYPTAGALFLDPDRRRELVLVGPWREKDLPSELAAYRPAVFSVEPAGFPDAAATLRALVAEKELRFRHSAGIDLARWIELAQRLRQANYGVIAWSAGDLDFPHADLTIRSLSELVRDLNTKTRCSALPLAGNQGDMTANQVCLWQTGYPLRTQCGDGGIRHDSYLNDYRRLLDSGEADALLWICGFTPDHHPPPTDIPVIVAGHPRMAFDRPPAVFIPTGVPGIDHSGHIYRGDGVVSLPLKKLRKAMWPSAASMLNAICDSLESAVENTEKTEY